MPGRLSARAGRDRELGRRGPVLWVGVTSPGAGHLTLLRLCLSDLSGNLTASMLEKMCCKCQDRVFGTNPSRENWGWRTRTSRQAWAGPRIGKRLLKGPDSEYFILDFVDQEANSRLLCQYLHNYLKM